MSRFFAMDFEDHVEAVSSQDVRVEEKRNIEEVDATFDAADPVGGFGIFQERKRLLSEEKDGEDKIG